MKNNTLKATYDKIATDWTKDHEPDDWWVSVTEKLVHMLPKGASVLDVGCGPGWKASFLTSRGLSVTAFDFSDEMIRIAREKFPHIRFEVRDVYDLGAFKETFDCVFAQAVLLHIPRERAVEVLKLMKEKVRPGGLLYAAVKMSNKGVEEEVLREHDYGYDYERFFSYYTQEEMEGYFKELGFDIVLSDVTSSGRTNWVQVIGRQSA